MIFRHYAGWGPFCLVAVSMAGCAVAAPAASLPQTVEPHLAAPAAFDASARSWSEPFTGPYRLDHQWTVVPSERFRGPGGEIRLVPAGVRADDGDLQGGALASANAELDRLADVCGIAGGRVDDDHGFHDVHPRTMTALRRDGTAPQSRVLISGSAVYQGAETAELGAFLCLVEDDVATFWTFDPS